MFCSNCGMEIADGSRFCGGCGAKQESATAALPATVADEIDYALYGDDMQMVEIELLPGRAVISEAGAMMFMEQDIVIDTVFGDGSAASGNQSFMGKLGNAAKRALTGESLFMNIFTNNGQGKSRVAFAAPYPGKIIATHLRDLGGNIICQKKSFLCAARGINVDIALQKKLGAGFFGGEGFIMQRLSGDGMVFIHAGGTIIKRELNPDEVLRLDTGCLVALSSSIDYDVQLAANVKTALFGGEGIFLATLRGPGTVWMQSLPFSRMANEIISAARKNNEESKGIINNPVNEVKEGLGGALGGLLKF